MRMVVLLVLPVVAALAVGCATPKEESQPVRSAAVAMPSVAVPFELGKSDLAAGDAIVITAVESASPAFEAGGTYTVRGTYQLASADTATLLLALTSDDPKAAVANYPDSASTTAHRGGGEFVLTNVFLAKGQPHLSFYPAGGGQSFGGVYFGAGEWLLR